MNVLANLKKKKKCHYRNSAKCYGSDYFLYFLTYFKDANLSITDRFAENVHLFTNKHLHLVACIFTTIYYVSLMLDLK